MPPDASNRLFLRRDIFAQLQGWGCEPLANQGDKGLMAQGNWPVRTQRVATTEEAEMALTRLFAEWELRMRRLQAEGTAARGSAERLAAEDRVIQQLAALG